MKKRNQYKKSKLIATIAIVTASILIIGSCYSLIKQSYFHYSALPGVAKIYEIKHRSEIEGSLPGVSGRISLMRGDPGGPRQISIQDLTIEYQDPKLGKVHSQISTRAAAFSIGESIRIKFIAGDIGTVKLFENKFDSLMHYGGSWVLFIVSVFFLQYSLKIKG